MSRQLMAYTALVLLLLSVFKLSTGSPVMKECNPTELENKIGDCIVDRCALYDFMECTYPALQDPSNTIYAQCEVLAQRDLHCRQQEEDPCVTANLLYIFDLCQNNKKSAPLLKYCSDGILDSKAVRQELERRCTVNKSYSWTSTS